MINFDDVTKENIKEGNPNWPQIPDYPYRILIIGSSGSGETNSLFNEISHQPDIDKIYLYPKDPYEAKHQLLINKREIADLEHLSDCKAFIEYSNDIDDIYKNFEEYNPNKKYKILIFLLIWLLIYLVIKNRGIKLNISLIFITQSYFAVPKNIRLNSADYVIMKIPNKWDLQQIAFDHSYVDFKDANLTTDDPFRLRKNILERI